jgi:hypothetical protein
MSQADPVFRGAEFVDGIGTGPGDTPEWEAGATLARRAGARRLELEREHGPLIVHNRWDREADRLTLRSDYFRARAEGEAAE